MILENAKQFITYNIKQGIYEAEDFDDFGNEDLIGFAKCEQARGLTGHDLRKYG